MGSCTTRKTARRGVGAGQPVVTPRATSRPRRTIRFRAKSQRAGDTGGEVRERERERERGGERKRLSHQLGQARTGHASKTRPRAARSAPPPSHRAPPPGLFRRGDQRKAAEGMRPELRSQTRRQLRTVLASFRQARASRVRLSSVAAPVADAPTPHYPPTPGAKKARTAARPPASIRRARRRRPSEAKRDVRLLSR